MKSIKFKLIIIMICIIQLLCITIPVFAKKDPVKTSYNWSDYSNKTAEYWVGFYNRMSNKKDKLWSLDTTTVIYKDEFELLALAYLNSEAIDKKITDANYFDTSIKNYMAYMGDYNFEILYEDIHAYKDQAYKDTDIGVDKELTNAVKKNSYKFECRDKMYWAMKLAQIYQDYDKKNSLDAWQDEALKYLKGLVDSNYAFPSLNKDEKKQITNEYKNTPEMSDMKSYIVSLYEKIYGVNEEKEPELEKPELEKPELEKPTVGGKIPVGYEDGEATTTIDPDKFAPVISNDDPGKATDLVGKIVGAINVIGTVIAIATVMILGIKYIFGSIEQKAEYKKTMWPILVGAILLFGVTWIINLIYKIVPNNV